jgi:endonuclease YncB( thermonuclease family)
VLLRMRSRRGRAALLVPVLLLIAAGAVSLLPGFFDTGSAISGFARVVDGDTLAVAGRNVRLEGIDAPESRQTCHRDGVRWPCGAQATQQLSLLVQGRVVDCTPSGEDRYGRTLARCRAGGEDVAVAMVRDGWAVAYTTYSWRYLPEELRARWRGAGLWAGSFQAPEDWRREHRR